MSHLSIEDIIEFVEENDVKFIRLAFCDLYGTQKNISIMPQELKTAFEDGINFDSFLILGYSNVEKDLFLKPDPDTLHVLPWRPQSGRVIRFYCDVVYADGTPFSLDYRHFLKDTLKECEEMGFTTRMGLKSEFYLFKTDENGNPTREPFDNGGYLDVAPNDKGENIRREICLTLEEMGISPQSSHHERGPGQNEIDFESADVLTTADNLVTYKNVVENIAARNGAYACFEPKPIEGAPGNGLHIRMANYKGETNLVTEDKDFSESFMAGIINRMRDITLFLNCRADSYNRFGQQEAPKYITWSQQNNSRLFRVPEINGKRKHFILRSPDSCINPYLASAIILQAGMAGVRGKEKLPPALEINSRLLTDDNQSAYLEMLPQTIEEAIECASNSEFIKQSSFADIAKNYIETITASI
ncbi:glutamine synthetase family protein [Pseudobutyrivibrio xylanivorans]|uniref:Glutamine synthetase n=1 Tax=Pseudobutyrivibrio xylanivorans TaxID=185007 RepID=A0A5P6VRK9_PSEXY|nr:glutamine synthetase family protein [Pseudobutyrivibrio xylanivorans]QFJ55345.1 glutamine synthetase [Pseudobutyrivibrio xylanivorans]